MNRKQKRDAKNARHRKNERRRDVLKGMRQMGDYWSNYLKVSKEKAIAEAIAWVYR